MHRNHNEKFTTCRDYLFSRANVCGGEAFDNLFLPARLLLGRGRTSGLALSLLRSHLGRPPPPLTSLLLRSSVIVPTRYLTVSVLMIQLVVVLVIVLVKVQVTAGKIAVGVPLGT